MSTGQRIDVVFTLFVRLFLAGVFGFAAFMKLRNPDAAQAFAESIQAFQVLDKFDHHHVVVVSAFAVPWLEAICAVLILLGLWTRAAAFAMLGALGVFMYAIYTVIARELNVECGCFGDFNFPCHDTVGMCQMYRNGVLAVGCLFLVVRGGGRASLDGLIGPRKPKDDAGEPSQSEPRRPVSASARDEGSIPLDPERPTPLSSPPSEPKPADTPSKPRWD
ncbi:MAG: DoxX family membrane protein [Phycisphaerales bacterium]